MTYNQKPKRNDDGRMRKIKRRERFARFLHALRNPPDWVAWITLVTAAVLCPIIIYTVANEYVHTVYAALASVFCVLLLVYAMIVAVNASMKIRITLRKEADKHEFTRNLYKNYEFRTLVSGAIAFLCNVGYTVVCIVMAFRYRSVWYGTLGMYYILLVIARGGALMQSRKDEKRYRYDYYGRQIAKVGIYRFCGIMLVVLSVSLGIPVVELILGDVGFHQDTWLIYVFGAVALYKVVTGVVHFVHSTKGDDLVVRSVRYINLAVTLMSVLCLQTAILAAYPPANSSGPVLNGLTGTAVCLVTLAIGVYMIVFSGKAKRELLKQGIALAELAEVESFLEEEPSCAEETVEEDIVETYVEQPTEEA